MELDVKLTCIICKVGLLAMIGVMLAGGLGGCNEKTLWKDNDRILQQRVDHFDSETTQVARQRRKQQNEWGFGPNLFRGGDN
jgi:hypothetical protein